jgi:hypothetical protein
MHRACSPYRILVCFTLTAEPCQRQSIIPTFYSGMLYLGHAFLGVNQQSVVPCSRLAQHLYSSLGRVSEAIHVLEGFARTENALPVAHLLVTWYEELNQRKEAEKWLEYGVKREEPEAMLLHVR